MIVVLMVVPHVVDTRKMPLLLMGQIINTSPKKTLSPNFSNFYVVYVKA